MELPTKSALWEKCLARLESELPAQQFNTWIRPLQALEDGSGLRLLAPNRFVLDWVSDRFLDQITQVVVDLNGGRNTAVALEIGTRAPTGTPAKDPEPTSPGRGRAGNNGPYAAQHNGLNPQLTFESFVVGKCNQLAHAACLQVAENAGSSYNPLFIYGGVGLGKTHLMHAVGNQIRKLGPTRRVVYMHSERFVGDMVRALQHKTIDEFKRFYRTLDALLVDDIQFFAGKDHTQEEFFHTFNALLEGQQQVILTCDRYPKEVNGLEERLKSRFGWGLTVAMEPPELETRVAILMSKASQVGACLPDEVAFFIGKRIRSNVRELEGALRRVLANAQFTGKPVTLEFAKEALKDVLALHEKLVTMENIQKTVAAYYKLRVTDLLSKSRMRTVARPRQMAMALAKELTEHSLPEIGDAFGGRDHTTVLHACKKIAGLKEQDARVMEDFTSLSKMLTT